VGWLVARLFSSQTQFYHSCIHASSSSSTRSAPLFCVVPSEQLKCEADQERVVISFSCFVDWKLERTNEGNGTESKSVTQALPRLVLLLQSRKGSRFRHVLCELFRCFRRSEQSNGIGRTRAIITKRATMNVFRLPTHKNHSARTAQQRLYYLGQRHFDQAASCPATL